MSKIKAIQNLKTNHPEYGLQYVETPSGPQHLTQNICVYSMGQEQLGSAIAKTKQEAKRLAAEEAWEVLDRRGYFK